MKSIKKTFALSLAIGLTLGTQANENPFKDARNKIKSFIKKVDNFRKGNPARLKKAINFVGTNFRKIDKKGRVNSWIKKRIQRGRVSKRTVWQRRNWNSTDSARKIGRDICLSIAAKCKRTIKHTKYLLKKLNPRNTNLGSRVGDIEDPENTQTEDHSEVQSPDSDPKVGLSEEPEENSTHDSKYKLNQAKQNAANKFFYLHHYDPDYELNNPKYQKSREKFGDSSDILLGNFENKKRYHTTIAAPITSVTAMDIRDIYQEPYEDKLPSNEDFDQIEAAYLENQLKQCIQTGRANQAEIQKNGKKKWRNYNSYYSAEELGTMETIAEKPEEECTKLITSMLVKNGLELHKIWLDHTRMIEANEQGDISSVEFARQRRDLWARFQSLPEEIDGDVVELPSSDDANQSEDNLPEETETTEQPETTDRVESEQTSTEKKPERTDL